jgi:D-aminoacyl-tRNA deacylase
VTGGEVRALLQRVSEASVTSAARRGDAGVVTGRIGAGLVAMIGVAPDDTAAAAVRLADKLWRLRIFEDEDGVANRSCEDVGGAVLVISQFTLYADTRKGRRPSYLGAARPEVAEPLVEVLMARLGELGAQVEGGRFRTHMQVSLTNDGPFTVLVEV